MLTKGQNIKVKIFLNDAQEKLEEEVNAWLRKCRDEVFDIQYKHCYSAWHEESFTGVGMEREFSIMVIYGKKDVI